MLQVFLSVPNRLVPDLEKDDGFPISARLLTELSAKYPSEVPAAAEKKFECGLSAASALLFLRDFYARYELAYPQKRVWWRLESFLSELPGDQPVRLVAANVSEQRSRKFSKKT